MHSVIITAHVLHASALAYALKNQNIHCSIATVNSLDHNWTPETDAFLFPHPLEEAQIAILEKFIKNVPKKTPLIFFSSSQKRYFTRPGMNPLLTQALFLDDSIPLAQVPLLIKDILQKNPQNRELIMGDITVDRINRTIKRDDRTVVLSKKEFFLLELLILNSGRVTTRENIIDYVWDKRDYVGANTIDVYVCRLRKKLNDPVHPTANKDFIRTYPCLGYQLNL